MDSEDPVERTDRVLEVLSRPLTRYVLAVLAGVDPGAFDEPLTPVNGTSDDSDPDEP